MFPMLNADQIEIVEEQVLQKICEANRKGSLLELLSDMGWLDILDEVQNSDNHFHSDPTGQIVVLGASEVKEKHLWGVCKELGFTDKDRFEFHLDYCSLKNFRYQKLQWNDSYRLVLVGPSPHKTTGTGEYASLISALENEPGYPCTKHLSANRSLKITKNNFKAALEDLLNRGFLVA